MRIPCVFALVVGLALPALATPPSEECRDTAPACRDAFVKLDACEKKNSETPEDCAAERADTDTSCKASASACDRDGSKRTP